MVTLSDAGTEEQPLKVIVKLYVPLITVVTLFLGGFCKVLVNPTGPVHE